MYHIRDWMNNHFGFTKKEFNGLLVLFAIMIVLAVFPYVFNFSESTTNEQLNERNAIQKLSILSDGNNQHDAASQDKNNDFVNHLTAKLFVFDPNVIDLKQWQQLGLSAKQASSVIKYRNKGGRFRKVEDLSKMYTISAEMYQRLAPYVKIGSNLKRKSASKVIEINTADTTLLTEIIGIGSVFARRIVQYRERLGGFYQKEQLMEVYGLNTSKYLEIKNQIRIDTRNVRKINLNTATFETLRQNPYLRYKQINAILEYRKQHGDYKTIDDLHQVLILDPKTIHSLTPYLVF